MIPHTEWQMQVERGDCLHPTWMPPIIFFDKILLDGFRQLIPIDDNI
jgi:hypothetical protein